MIVLKRFFCIVGDEVVINADKGDKMSIKIIWKDLLQILKEIKIVSFIGKFVKKNIEIE